MKENNLFTLNRTVGSMVTSFPKAAGVFNQFKIDYCCKGDDTLDEAAKKVNADPQKVAKALQDLYDTGKHQPENSSGKDYVDYESFTTKELLDHILDTHHVYTKKAFQDIDDLLFKILKVHFMLHSEELLEVHKLFGILKAELEEHLIKEEEQMFPLMYDYETGKSQALLKDIKKYIETTENEHDAAGDILKKLEKATNDFTAPPGACPTYLWTYKALDELEKNIFSHIHKENSILFKRYAVE